MRTFLTWMLTLSACFFCVAGCAHKESRDLSELENIQLDIITCSCGTNINEIKKILKNTQGVVQSTVRYQPTQAVVFFDPAVTSAQTIINRLDTNGYVVGQMTHLSE
ncbi:MAG: hypothetical protein R6V55_10510 [Desulfovermiculus sp.]